MNNPAHKIASYEDLFALPDNVVGQIIHGQLLTYPRPAPRHALASSGLGGELMAPYHRGRGGPGGWWILDEPELHLQAHILVPDLAGWRRERMPTLPETAYFEIAPDWLCEVLSPATARVDRIQKMPIYAQCGVSYVWLLDPDLRTLEVFVLDKGYWRLESVFQNSDVVSAVPFDATGFSLADLWPPEP